jgi:hypothetical protein
MSGGVRHAPRRLRLRNRGALRTGRRAYDRRLLTSSATPVGAHRRFPRADHDGRLSSALPAYLAVPTCGTPGRTGPSSRCGTTWFSWNGWQSLQDFGPGQGGPRPAQTRKVAANQAWFEYQPARVARPGDVGDDRFHPPEVRDGPPGVADEHGLLQGRDNLAAIGSLEIFRGFRWGRNVELLLTDNRSFRSEPVMNRPEAQPFHAEKARWFAPADVVAVLDAGRTFAGGNPPATSRFGGEHPTPRIPPGSMLGARRRTGSGARRPGSLEGVGNSVRSSAGGSTCTTSPDLRGPGRAPAMASSATRLGGYRAGGPSRRFTRQQDLRAGLHRRRPARLLCRRAVSHAAAGRLSHSRGVHPGSVSAQSRRDGRTRHRADTAAALFLHRAQAAAPVRRERGASAVCDRAALGAVVTRRSGERNPRWRHLAFVDVGGHSYSRCGRRPTRWRWSSSAFPVGRRSGGRMAAGTVPHHSPAREVGGGCRAGSNAGATSPSTGTHSCGSSFATLQGHLDPA